VLPEQNARLRLNDILSFIEEILSFIAGMTQAEFCRDRKTANAVILDFSILARPWRIFRLKYRRNIPKYRGDS